MGEIAQINATCLHASINPKLITTKVPKLFDVMVTVVIIPRYAGSLELKGWFN